MFNTFFPENRAVYDIMSKNLVDPERSWTIWRMHVACWLSETTCAKAHARSRGSPHTHTHARTHSHTHEYEKLTAFPRQQFFVNAPQC